MISGATEEELDIANNIADYQLALRTLEYLKAYYKTHDETLINSDEIEAIDFMLEENEQLERAIKYLSECINEKDGLLYNYMKENKQLKDNWNELKEYILNHYIVGHTIQNASMDSILEKIQELEDK